MSVCGINGCPLPPYHAGICRAPDLGSRTRGVASSPQLSPTNLPGNVVVPRLTSDRAENSSVCSPRAPQADGCDACGECAEDTPLASELATSKGADDAGGRASAAASGEREGDESGDDDEKDDDDEDDEEEDNDDDDDDDEEEDDSSPGRRLVCGIQGCTLPSYHAGLCSVPTPSNRRAAVAAASAARLSAARVSATAARAGGPAPAREKKAVGDTAGGAAVARPSSKRARTEARASVAEVKRAHAPREGARGGGRGAAAGTGALEPDAPADDVEMGEVREDADADEDEDLDEEDKEVHGGAAGEQGAGDGKSDEDVRIIGQQSTQHHKEVWSLEEEDGKRTAECVNDAAAGLV